MNDRASIARECVGERASQRVASDGPKLDGFSDGTGGLLRLLTSAGSSAWTVRNLATPVGVAATGGEIYVLERGARRVSVWSTVGERLRELPIEAGQPAGLAIGPSPGELAITDIDSATVVVASVATGRTLRVVGNGRLTFPSGVATSNGRIAVADSGLGKVVLFDASGNFLATLAGEPLLVRPQGLAWDTSSQRLIVVDAFSGELVVVGEDGVVRGTLGGFGSGAGQLVNPIDVALGPGGLLAVSTAGGTVPLFRLLETLRPLAPPTSLVAADRPGDDGGAVALSWTRSGDDQGRLAGYRVERAAGDSGRYVPLADLPSGTTAFVDSGASDATCQRYRIVATDGSSEAASDESACVVARNDLPPPAPEFLSASPSTPREISLEWRTVTARDLRSYEVTITSAAAPVRTIAAAAGMTTLSVDSLAPDTRYEFAVRAVDTAGNSSTAAAASAATFPDVAPPAPLAVTALDAATGGAAEVTWTAPISRVPVARYRVAITPETAGWPSSHSETTSTSTRANGLVNKLGYVVTVAAETAWGRAGEPSVPVRVTPTAPARELPVVAMAGWDGASGMSEAAGVTARFSVEADRRELRFLYRAVGARVQPLLDGSPVGEALPDTGGAWVETALRIDKRQLQSSPTHLIELRSVAFPDPAAQVAVKRLDLVPMPPRDSRPESFNSVVDLTWSWDEPRADLQMAIVRTDVAKRTPEVAVRCTNALLGRCRDTFLPNGDNFSWRLAALSPAGWMSEVSSINGHATFSELPPPVTDLTVEQVTDPPGSPALRLSWTPLSVAASKNAAPSAVTAYRVYRIVDGVPLFVTEATAPPVLVAPAGGAAFVVRSLDAAGKESR